MYDPSGHLPKIIENIINYFLDDEQSIPEGLKEDFHNFNINNQSEEVVRKSNYFSCYNGNFVIRMNGDRSASFGVLFISRVREYETDSFYDEVRHEYGHTKQLRELGAIKYLLCIGVPSYYQWGSDKEYYRRPWEITADIFGNVQSRKEKYPNYEAAGYEYLENSKKMGIFVWLTIK